MLNLLYEALKLKGSTNHDAPSTGSTFMLNRVRQDSELLPGMIGLTREGRV